MNTILAWIENNELTIAFGAALAASLAVYSARKNPWIAGGVGAAILVIIPVIVEQLPIPASSMTSSSTAAVSSTPGQTN
jgi:hypothetical protein